MKVQSPTVSLALLTLLLALTAALLFAALRVPPDRTIDVGGAGDNHFIANFFPIEQSGEANFRWSTSGSRLLLHGADAGPLALGMRFHGDERALAGDWRLQLERHGQNLARMDIEPGWRVYHVLLPAGAAVGPDGQAAPLDLVISAYRSAPRDPRLLGVPVDWVRLLPLVSETTSVAVPLRRTLMLTWGLALLAGVLWCLDHRLWPVDHTPMRLLRVGVPVSVIAAGLVFWAHRDPYTLAWALPLSPWGLGLATLGLFGFWILDFGFWSVTRGGAEARRRSDEQQSPHLVTRSPPHPVTLLALLVSLAHLVLLAPLPVAWRGTAALLLLALPGALLALLLFRAERDRLLRAFLAICGAVALPPLVLLALHAVPGPLPWWLLLIATDVLILLTGGLLLRAATADRRPSTVDRRALTADHDSHPVTPAPGHPRTRSPPHPVTTILNSPSSIFTAILLLGAVLRLAFLGSAEFQGDEGRALLGAAGVRYGQDAILLLHKKGPVEILLPAGPLILTQHMNEWVARLPFALAGMGVLLGSYVLGRALFDPEPDSPGDGTYVGLLAATILALDGFMIAFSRIVQYQSVVVLMMLGALWCAWRFAFLPAPFERGAGGEGRYLVCAAILAAMGLLAHYDAVFVLPAVAWLVLAGGGRRGWRGMQWIRGLAAPLLVGAGLLASFYIPFALNERFTRTFEYVIGRTGQDNVAVTLYNNLIDYYRLATFYNTTFQMQALAVALAAGFLAWVVMYVRPRGLGWALAALLVVGSAILIWSPQRFELARGGSWAVIAFALPIAGLVFSPATPAALRVLVLWFGAAFVAEAFLISSPKTHFYTMHTAAALLIALAVVRLAQWLQARRLPWIQVPLAAGGIALLLLAIPYAYLVFVRQEPEYRTVFPEARPDIYQASYGDARPQGGYFGFPRRAGWKVIGELYRQGVLQGDYDSNEKELITGWYTRGTLRCWRDTAYYFAAWTVASSTTDIDVPAGYWLLGSVLVDNVKKMDIYSQQPVSHPPQIFTLEDYRAAFDAQPVTNFPIQRSLIEIVPQYRLNASWQQDVLLRGYDLDRQQVTPGQVATLVLYWREHTTITPGYEPVVHVLDKRGAIVGSAIPHCDVPPSQWNTQYLSGVAFTVTADARMPPGEYTLQVGLRHTQTDMWLPLADGTSALNFATLTVVSR